MRIVNDHTDEVLVDSVFAGVEESGYTYSIFLQSHFTIQMGKEEWKRLQVLVATRYKHGAKPVLTCTRCKQQFVYPGFQTDICGTCADDLRQDELAEEGAIKAAGELVKEVKGQ